MLSITWTNGTFIAYQDGLSTVTNLSTIPYIRISGSLNPKWLCLGAYQHDGTPTWGDDQYPNTGFFKGKMDDLRIYDRTLSSTEIGILFNGQGNVLLGNTNNNNILTKHRRNSIMRIIQGL
jgi:hypothetical protein